MSGWIVAGAPRRTTAELGLVTVLSARETRRSSALGEPTGAVHRRPLAEGATEYDELYRAHQGHVRRLCRLWLSDADEAEDVSQEVFLKLLRQHQRGGNTIVWGAWLTRVTVNACRDRRRSGWWKWWRERHQEFNEADLSGQASTPEQEMLSLERRRHVWQAFRKLSSRQQEVFALRLVEGCSTAEVADILGVSPGSIKRHLYRAVQQMRKTLRGLR